MVLAKNLRKEMTTLLKTKHFLGIAVCACCFFFSSCENEEAYHKFQDVKQSLWSKNDSLCFIIDTTDIRPGVAYDIQIETVNNSLFPYQNLWLFVRSNVDAERIFRQDTMQIQLADVYGKWTGSGFGAYYQNAILFRKRVVFPMKRKYTFQVIQGMRDEPLAGIEKIGLKISRSK